MLCPLKVDARKHDKRNGGFINSNNRHNVAIGPNGTKPFSSNISYEKHRSSASPGQTTLRVGRQNRSSPVKARQPRSKFLKRTSMS